MIDRSIDVKCVKYFVQRRSLHCRTDRTTLSIDRYCRRLISQQLPCDFNQSILFTCRIKEGKKKEIESTWTWPQVCVAVPRRRTQKKKGADRREDEGEEREDCKAEKQTDKARGAAPAGSSRAIKIARRAGDALLARARS